MINVLFLHYYAARKRLRLGLPILIIKTKCLMIFVFLILFKSLLGDIHIVTKLIKNWMNDGYIHSVVTSFFGQFSRFAFDQMFSCQVTVYVIFYLLVIGLPRLCTIYFNWYTPLTLLRWFLATLSVFIYFKCFYRESLVLIGFILR